MKRIQKEISGETTEVCVYGEKIRLYCEGSFYPTDETAVHMVKAPSNRFGISIYPDGSFNVCMLMLVPSSLCTHELDEIADEMLYEMESALRIPYGYLSSSSWWAGHENDDYDHLLSVKDLEYLNSHRE